MAAKCSNYARNWGYDFPFGLCFSMQIMLKNICQLIVSHWCQWKKTKSVCGFSSLDQIPPLSLGTTIQASPHEKAEVLCTAFVRQFSAPTKTNSPLITPITPALSVAKPVTDAPATAWFMSQSKSQRLEGAMVAHACPASPESKTDLPLEARERPKISLSLLRHSKVCEYYPCTCEYSLRNTGTLLPACSSSLYLSSFIPSSCLLWSSL